MGSASSKFRKHLQSGDEVQALQLYRANSELRKVLDPNCSYGDSHHHETPLHLAARHGMQTLLGIFLFSKGGNPNKTNARKETCLHNVCMETNWQSVHVCKRRSECLNYLLKWRGAKLGESHMEKIDLAAQDEKDNTALHYAAASGLTQCVETLVTYGAPLFVENEDNLTPCDTAERSGHAKIALYLESKMVFSNDEEPQEQEDNISMPPIEEYSGLRPQDLQEAKDQLLVETADMLSVPLFTAEALLRNHEWSREMLLEAWMTDPVACCEKCGVTPPTTLFSEKPEVQENLASPLPSPLHSAPMPLDAECDICANKFLIADEPVHMTCTHRFCKECWERYLNVKIQEGDAHHITCPAYDCTMLVPVDIIEGIVSRDMARRYLQFDIKAFVDSNPDMKWCPFPGCGRAVKLPELDTNRSTGNRNKIPSDTSRGVDCGVGHYFCWECLEESHEPCSCSNWSKWFQKISEIRPETLSGTEQETEVAANCLWLVTNSKPCPNCKSPIQKNEGCNHMKCSKCKYDFCWVCLEQWKWHNSSTGGYFKCNRFEVVKKVEEQSAQLMNEAITFRYLLNSLGSIHTAQQPVRRIHTSILTSRYSFTPESSEAESKNKNMQELNRFVHYYTRFKNHENSFKLEEPLLKTAKDKMMKLAEAVTDNATAHSETKFVEDAVQQLLKARRVLRCSYVYGYYLDGPGYKKIVFEFMQTELEECTEILSQMVNRLYLRTPRRKIMEQACIVQRKRHEFIMAISKGLVPPETPPSVRKNKKRRKFSTDAVDEDLHRAIVASIQEVDPANPWIKDASGRHTNLVALLEWPSEDSEDDSSEVESDQKAKRESIGKCQRPSCNKVKARNPRTKGLHDYCSRWCMLVDKEMSSEDKSLTQVAMDEHMELLRALEMSRLQYLRDSGLLHDLDMPLKSNQPRGHKAKHRPRSNSAGQEAKKKSQSGLSSIEELGIELQRFQELSSGFPKGGQDKEGELKQSGMKLGHRHPRKPTQSSRFEESKSTVVTRVPNKSVEDLYCLDPSLKGPVLGQASKSPTLAAHGSPSMAKTGLEAKGSSPAKTVTSDFPSFSSAEGHGAACSKSTSLFGSMFGAIKDLSVSNIHSSENDKTKDFLSKDLASIFSGWDLVDDTGDDFAEAETSSHPQTCFNNLSPCYSPKRSNITDSPSTSSSGKGNSGKSSAGKSLLKPERSGLKSDFAIREDNVIRNRDGDYTKKRFYQSSCIPAEDDLARGGASAGDIYIASEEGEREDSGRVDKDGEVSLLKMAENLLQMTADVHSRMKAVERGIRDLEGICDLDARSKVKSTIGYSQKPDAYSGKEERSPTFSRKDTGNKTLEEDCYCTDFEDVEQWFDVSEAIGQNSSTVNDRLKTGEETEKQREPHYYKTLEEASSSAEGESVIPSSIDQRESRADSMLSSSSHHIPKSYLSEYAEASAMSGSLPGGISRKNVATCKNLSYPTGNIHAVVVEDIKTSFEEGPSLSRSATSAYPDEQMAYSAKYYSKDNLVSQRRKKHQEAEEGSLACATSAADKRAKLLLPLCRAVETSEDMGPHSFSPSLSDAGHSPALPFKENAKALSFPEAAGSSKRKDGGELNSRNLDLSYLANRSAVESPGSSVYSRGEKEDSAKSTDLSSEGSNSSPGEKEAETSESTPSMKEEDNYWDSVYV